MNEPIPSLLLILVIKCSINWTVVVYQWRHMGRSFLGTFCISLALGDTLLVLVLCTIYGLHDFHLLGVRFTLYHICLLIQIACFTSSLLHWPVFLLAGLDHYWTLRFCPHHRHWSHRLAYALGVCVVWTLAFLYVILGSGFYPDLERTHLLLRQCVVSSSPQSVRLSAFLLLALACTFLYCYPELRTAASAWSASASRTGRLLSRYLLYLLAKRFLETWAPFVLLQTAILLLRLEIPAHLDMNVPWLCFLNSFLVAAVLWDRFQDFNLGKIPMPVDGFCDWHYDLDAISTEVNSER